MAVNGQIDRGGASPTVRGSPSIDMARPRIGDASLAAAPDRRRMQWGVEQFIMQRFCGAKKNVITSRCAITVLSFFVRVVGPSCSLWNQAGGICKAVLETRM